MNTPKVGLFFYVNGKILTDFVDITHAEIYGDFKIGTTSHFDIWDTEYYKLYNRQYDYFPRGRVVYKYKENKFILYADKCIDEIGINEILKVFKIADESVKIDRTDEHYVCKKCNKNYVE